MSTRQLILVFPNPSSICTEPPTPLGSSFHAEKVDSLLFRPCDSPHSHTPPSPGRFPSESRRDKTTGVPIVSRLLDSRCHSPSLASFPRDRSLEEHDSTHLDKDLPEIVTDSGLVDTDTFASSRPPSPDLNHWGRGKTGVKGPKMEFCRNG